MSLTRRDLLKFSGSTAAVLAACRSDGTLTDGTTDAENSSAITQIQNGHSVNALAANTDFMLGVSAGDVTPSEANLWTRYDGSATLSAYVWNADSGELFAQIANVTSVDGFVHYKLQGLTAGARYAFAFVADGKRSPVGNFRAAIAPDALEVITFGGYACTHYRREPYPALSFLAKNPLDFWVAGGDKVYCDDLNADPAKYHAAYERVYSQKGYLDLHSAAGQYGVWDDHEFNESYNVQKTPASETQLAENVFYQHTPFNQGPDNRIWRSFRWGKTLELFIMDCRTERNPDKNQYISPEQMAWIKQALSDSPCTFKMIVNTVPIGQFPVVFDAKSYDRWSGFPAQRTELLTYVEANDISDVWWLSGDFHFGSIGRVAPEGALGSKQNEILWGPGGNRADPLYVLLDQPQWDFSTGDCNAVTLRCDPVAHTVQVTFVNDHGDTIFQKTY